MDKTEYDSITNRAFTLYRAAMKPGDVEPVHSQVTSFMGVYVELYDGDKILIAAFRIEGTGEWSRFVDLPSWLGPLVPDSGWHV